MACAATYKARKILVFAVVRPIWPSVEIAPDCHRLFLNRRRAYTKFDAICSHASSLGPARASVLR